MNKVYSKIESISGSVITVRAEGVKYNELAEIETAFGTSLAEVNRIDGDLVSLQVFAGGRGVSTGDKIRFLGRMAIARKNSRFSTVNVIVHTSLTSRITFCSAIST